MFREFNRNGSPLQLKIQIQQNSNLTTKRTKTSKIVSKMAGSFCFQPKIKEKQNPKSFHSSTHLPKESLNKISNIMFTFPELVPSLDNDQERLIQSQVGKHESPQNVKVGFLRSQKNISALYHKQLEQLKIIKESVVTQKVFTIMNLKNPECEATKYDLGGKGKVKKLSFPATSMDRYQVTRNIEEKGNFLQLKIKKYEKGLSEEARASLKAKFDLAVKGKFVNKKTTTQDLDCQDGNQIFQFTNIDYFSLISLFIFLNKIHVTLMCRKRKKKSKSNPKIYFFSKTEGLLNKIQQSGPYFVNICLQKKKKIHFLSKTVKIR